MDTVTISEVARRSGFPPSTLRYYEQVGLLDPPARTASGYRTYDEAVLERLSFIGGAKRMRFGLDEIGQLTRLWADGDCAPVQHRLLAMLADRHAAVENEIGELQAFARELSAMRARLDGIEPSDSCGPECGCDLRASGGGDPLDPPIVCTLDASDVGQRVSDWRTVRAAALSRLPTETGARLTFEPSSDLAAQLASLAAAETHCCGFFRMTLTMEADALTLDVSCPDSARPVLDELLDG